MPRFLFWNVAGKMIEQLIARVALSSDVDVLILAECTPSPVRILELLNTGSPDYRYAPGLCEKLTFFTKFEPLFFPAIYESNRVSVRELKLPARSELLVVGAHLPSKLHFSPDSQTLECAELSRLIREQESQVGHKRTLLVGDLNMNPFETGVAASVGLHAVMARDVALRGQRTVLGQSYDFFFNPMWSHLGEHEGGPPGTYYYEKAEHLTYFWNSFDQVLLRPDLLPGFDGRDLRILTEAGEQSLLDNRGRPNEAGASDHLPIVWELNF